jgi:hypothetical protein
LLLIGLLKGSSLRRQRSRLLGLLESKRRESDRVGVGSHESRGLGEASNRPEEDGERFGSCDEAKKDKGKRGDQTESQLCTQKPGQHGKRCSQLGAPSPVELGKADLTFDGLLRASDGAAGAGQAFALPDPLTRAPPLRDLAQEQSRFFLAHC